MGHRRRRRIAAGCSALFALAALTAGCGDGDDEGARAGEDASSTTTTTSAEETTTSAASTAPAAGSSTTTTGRTATTAASTSTTVRVAPAPGLSFTAPGTYRYATTGTFSSPFTGTQPRNGEATLVVDPPSGTDQRSVRQSFGRTTEQVLRLDAGGASLVSLRLRDQGIDKEVRPSPPGLALPADAAPGRTWSWRALSTDGATTVDSAFRALRTEEVTVGADRVPALVVEVVLTLTGDITVTSRQTLWVLVERRLIVRQDDATQGSAGLITFTATSSDVLKSLTPG